MLLAFDTETDGLINYHETYSHASQPHIVQLSAILYDDEENERSLMSVIVKPDGYSIPQAAANVHGITTEQASNYGVPLVVALAMFNHLAKAADAHVAHNVSFDLCVLGAAFHRAARPQHPLNPRCTQNLSTPILNLPPSPRMIAAGFNKPKPPRLSECYQFFFNEQLEGAHDALVDARGCARVYFELMRRAAAAS